MTTADISRGFEKLVRERRINFKPAAIGDLDKFGQMLVAAYLNSVGVGWLLGDVKIGSAYCLKVLDDAIGYLDVDPDTNQFLWSNHTHQIGIHPDEASIHLLRKVYSDEQLQHAMALLKIGW